MNKYTVRVLARRVLKSNIVELKIRLNGVKLEARKAIIIMRTGRVRLVETGHELLIRSHMRMVISTWASSHASWILVSCFVCGKLTPPL